MSHPEPGAIGELNPHTRLRAGPHPAGIVWPDADRHLAYSLGDKEALWPSSVRYVAGM